MKRAILAATVSIFAGLALVITGASPANAANPVPLPKALINHHFVEAFTPKQLIAWGPGSNKPGNCTSNNSEVFLNSAGYAEVSTSGQPGDCSDIESPTTFPTSDGYVYEEKLYISNFSQWNSYWMYGQNWPTDGEIDSFEGGPGTSYPTYHGAGNQTIGVGNWNTTPIQPQSANIRPGWNTVDIAFGGCGKGCGRIQIFYNGKPYVTMAGPLVLDGGRANDPFWLTDGTGSCDSLTNGNVCNGHKPTGGIMQIAYLRVFSMNPVIIQ
jgi:hypothetical protein